LVDRPAGGGPHPVVVILHGGPHAREEATYSPRVSTWVGEGFAVVRPNYRGSAGFGPAWENPPDYRVGFTELDDVAMVHRWIVDSGLGRGEQIILCGGSWGGYLALLAAGTSPDRWAAVIAVAPIADYVLAYEDETPDLQRIDRSIFGGAPVEVPDRYRDASPITYAKTVGAPILIIAGTQDPRCTPRQIRSYVDHARKAGKACQLHEFAGGHFARHTVERITQMAVELQFVRSALATTPAPARPPSPGSLHFAGRPDSEGDQAPAGSAT